MIGVIPGENQREAVEEFFELFKTSWEYCRRDESYDVVITTDPDAPIPAAKLLIVFCSKENRFDSRNGLGFLSREKGADIDWEGSTIPVYGDVATFMGTEKPFLCTRGGKAAGLVLDMQSGKVLRIGYDLFEEIGHLLGQGQPAERARVPTLDLHIAALRKWILDCGIPLAEIPPRPQGYDFITCLTHDIDFMGIRDHRFDRSMLGFIYRSLVPIYLKGLDRKTALSRYWKNLRALVSLPLVYAGILPDFWYPMDRYAEVEEGLKSTFFFIPFPNRHGEAPGGKAPRYRAARYDVGRYRESIRSLVQGGFEAGLHGIDSWRDSRAGREELEAIRGITGKEKIGVRMHWLYHSDKTPSLLEEAAFYFDSSLGYNDAVGYRNGTSQVFRLPGAAGVFELPLHLQDTAMFYPSRMNISEPNAMALCGKLVENFKEHGGVFTINWHDRSLVPERNWDAAYRELLGMLRGEKTWFATGGEAVRWFEKRRACRFEGLESPDGVPKVKMGASVAGDGPPLMLRVHRPPTPGGEDRHRDKYVDFPLTGDQDAAVGY